MDSRKPQAALKHAQSVTTGVLAVAAAIFIAAFYFIWHDVNTIAARVDSLADRLDGRLDAMSSRLDELVQRVADMNSKLDVIQANTQRASLERLERIEPGVGPLPPAVDPIATVR